MPERQQDIESFGDGQVQALFDKFLATPEPLLDMGDLLMQRVLSEVQLVYGKGAQSQSPVSHLTQRLTDWLAGFRPRAVVIAFSSVAVATVLVFSIALYSAIPAPVSIAATVPSGEVLILKPNSDSFRTYKAGDTFQLAEGDQIIARTGSVQLEPFPQQYADVMPGAQVELVTVDNEDGTRRVELFVIDGQVRHRGFEPLPAGDRYFVSTASLRAEFESSDFEIDAISPTRTIVTTRDGTAQIEAPSGNKALFAGQAAEVGERTLLIYDIAPLQEGPGEIAQAETLPSAAGMPDDSRAVEPPTDGEVPSAPAASLTALPIPRPDSAPPVTGASGGYITATGADSNSVLTVSRVSFDETQDEPVLLLSGYGPMGSSVQVLVEHQPVVTATVSTEGTWMASTPVNTVGRFEVDVVAVNDAGEVVASANAAQMEIGPPVKTPVPTPAEQSGIIAPPAGATATWTPGSGSGAHATATRTPTRRPTATHSPTETEAPIVFVAPVLPPTARPAPTTTATPEMSTPPAQDDPPFLVLVPSPTPSDTPASSATPKATATISATPLPTSTTLPTATSTNPPVATSTGTATTLPTGTATNPATPAPSSTSTATATPVATRTQAPVATATATATSILPTATATLPPVQPTAGSNTNLPPAGDTPSPTLGVFPTTTPTSPPIAPTATPTTMPPTATATSVPPTPTSVPPLVNAPGLNNTAPSDGTTNSGTLPSPPVAAPTLAPPTATPTTVPPTATNVVIAPTAAATQAAALPNLATGNTATNDAPPPVPATSAPLPTTVPPTAVPPTAVPPTAVPPTAVPPTAVPPTAVPLVAAPTIAAVPSSSGVSQPTGNTVPSDGVTTAPTTAPNVVNVPAPAATEPAAVSNLPAEATALPAATSAAVDSSPPAVDTVATPTN